MRVHRSAFAVGSFVAAVLGFLASCAMGTGILPAGPDTYIVKESYAPVRGGATTAEKVAMTEADMFVLLQARNFFRST